MTRHQSKLLNTQTHAYKVNTDGKKSAYKAINII